MNRKEKLTSRSEAAEPAKLPIYILIENAFSSFRVHASESRGRSRRKTNSIVANEVWLQFLIKFNFVRYRGLSCTKKNRRPIWIDFYFAAAAAAASVTAAVQFNSFYVAAVLLLLSNSCHDYWRSWIDIISLAKS